jgi:hypothetical protein
VKINDFKIGLKETEKYIDLVLNQIASRLGLDHDRVLGSRYSIPLMVGYLKKEGGSLHSSKQWNKLLYWYVHTFLWGRYAGSTESVLAQDLNIIENGEGVDGLIRLLRQNRGDLTIRPEDFSGWSTGSRFYPLLYMLTRVNHAKDWESGVEISSMLLGRGSSLEIHHIFPKSILYENGYSKATVNALANYALLTKSTNLKIGNREPKAYLPEYMASCPGAVESHWIPTGQAVWEIDKYEEFLKMRRQLLTDAANNFLGSLLNDSVPNVLVQNYTNHVPAGTVNMPPEEETVVSEIREWMEQNSLFPGFENYEVVDDDGTSVAIADLSWPEGIQKGLSEPVVLLIDESDDTKKRVNQRGYRYFTNVEEFKQYVSANYIS